MDYEFLECTVDGNADKTLIHNLKNLRQILPKEYRYGKNGRGGITAEINNCRFEKKDKDSFERKAMLLSDADIVLLD